MKILVAGAGAVGTMLGGKLALSGHDVYLFHYNREHCDFVNRNGICLVEQGIKRFARALAFHDLAQLFQSAGTVSLAIFSMKSFSTSAILAELIPFLSRIEHFVSVQNGLGNEEILLDYIKPLYLTAGSLTLACSMKSFSEVLVENKGGIALAPILPRSFPQWLAEIFKGAGFQVRVCPDWLSMKWSKLLLNMMMNATAALLDMTGEEIVSNRLLFKIERSMVLEALSVMEAFKMKPVSLPGYPVPVYAFLIKHLPEPLLRLAFHRKVRQARGMKLASLHLDFRQGKHQTEWPYLYGVLLAKAREKKIPVPVLETVCRLLEGVTSGEIPWEMLKRQPEALLDALSQTVMKSVSRSPVNE